MIRAIRLVPSPLEVKTEDGYFLVTDDHLGARQNHRVRGASTGRLLLSRVLRSRILVRLAEADYVADGDRPAPLGPDTGSFVLVSVVCLPFHPEARHGQRLLETFAQRRGRMQLSRLNTLPTAAVDFLSEATAPASRRDATKTGSPLGLGVTYR